MLLGEALEIIDASRDRLCKLGVFHGAEVGGEGSNDEPVLGPQYQDGFVIRDGLAGSAVDDAVIANPVFAFLGLEHSTLLETRIAILIYRGMPGGEGKSEDRGAVFAGVDSTLVGRLHGSFQDLFE
jgi:hypothetical protein